MYTLHIRTVRSSFMSIPILPCARIPISIFIGSFNVNARASHQSQITHWLGVSSTECDLYIIGLQEVVNLNVFNVGILPNHASGPWEDAVYVALQEATHPFVLMFSVQLVGLLMLGYVRKDYYPYINHFEVSKVATGYLGVGGNKGGIGVRFNLYDTSMCFVTSHFTAHQEKIKQRNEDYRIISTKLGFAAHPETARYPGQSSLTIFDHDYLFWSGDLNYRINSSRDDYSDVFDKVDNFDIDWLVKNDQLTIERQAGNVFTNWLEGEISFLPTYKFQPGTVFLERRPNKKLRGPSYCDRILYKIHPSLKVSLVNDMNSKIVSQIDSDAESYFRKESFKRELALSLVRKNSINSQFEEQEEFSVEFEQLFYTSNYSTISDHQPVSTVVSCTAFSKPARFITKSHGSIFDYIEIVHFIVLELQLSLAVSILDMQDSFGNYLFQAIAVSAGAVDHIFAGAVAHVREQLGATLPAQLPSYAYNSGVARFAVAAGLHPNNLFITTLLSGLLVVGLFAGMTILAYLFLLVMFNFVSYFRTQRAVENPYFHFRGYMLRLYLLYFSCISVTGFYQLTLNDYWLTFLLALLVVGPVAIGFVVVPAYYFFDLGEYYDLFKNVRKRITFSIFCSPFSLENRLWSIVRLFYLYLMAACVAFFNDNYKWLQVSLVLGIQVIYSVVLGMRTPYYDASQMWLQLIMHITRACTLTLTLVYIAIDNESLFSAFYLVSTRYALHGIVLVLFAFIRCRVYVAEFFLWIFPNFCKFCMFADWDHLVNNSNVEFQQSASMNTIQSQFKSIYVPGSASPFIRSSHVASDQDEPRDIRSVSIPALPTIATTNHLALKSAESENRAIHPRAPALSLIRPADGKVLFDAVLRKTAFGKVTSNQKDDISPLSNHEKYRTPNFVPAPSQSVIPVNDQNIGDEEDSGDDEDESTRMQRMDNFKQKLNFFQKLASFNME